MRISHLPAAGRKILAIPATRRPLSANMSETVTPGKFSVEGEAGLESDERIGAGPRWVGDRGGGEGEPAAGHGGVQAVWRGNIAPPPRRGGSWGRAPPPKRRGL